MSSIVFWEVDKWMEDIVGYVYFYFKKIVLLLFFILYWCFKVVKRRIEIKVGGNEGVIIE